MTTVSSGGAVFLQKPLLGQLVGVCEEKKPSWGNNTVNTPQAATSCSWKALTATGALPVGWRPRPGAEVPVEVLRCGCSPRRGSDPLRAPVGRGNITCHGAGAMAGEPGSGFVCVCGGTDQTAMAGVGLPRQRTSLRPIKKKGIHFPFLVGP